MLSRRESHSSSSNYPELPPSNCPKALGKRETYIEREPWIIRVKTDIYGKVIEGLRGDIGLNDFHPQKPKTIIDLQIFHPTISKSLEQEFVKNEKE